MWSTWCIGEGKTKKNRDAGTKSQKLKEQWSPCVACGNLVVHGPVQTAGRSGNRWIFRLMKTSRRPEQLDI